MDPRETALSGLEVGRSKRCHTGTPLGSPDQELDRAAPLETRRRGEPVELGVKAPGDLQAAERDAPRSRDLKEDGWTPRYVQAYDQGEA